ncbi:MAG TPA: hypothetical protein PKM37_07145, partial [Ornithinibacter sp.]|nr:hypothetical protein [Ornithinibacter sp.]
GLLVDDRTLDRQVGEVEASVEDAALEVHDGLEAERPLRCLGIWVGDEFVCRPSSRRDSPTTFMERSLPWM